MNNTRSVMIRNILLFAASVIALSGVFRLADQANTPYSGYITDGNNTVTRVDEGGPAERAGLRAGDYIRSIDGIPVEDTRAISRRARPRIGQTGSLVIESRGESLSGPNFPSRSVTFTYASSPGRYTALGFAAFFIGLCFLACGLTAGIRIPTRSGALLALTGVCLGAGFLGAPYFSSYSVRMLVQSVLIVIVVFGFAFLFHLMLEFPRPKPLLRKKHALKLIYGPALLVSLYALFLIVIQPPATSGLNQLTNLLFGLFLVMYFSGAAIAIIHSYAKATSQERARQGLHIIMVGILLGILPVTLATVLRIFAPRLVLPGADFLFVTLVLIPIALSVAVSRREHTAGIEILTQQAAHGGK